MEIVSGSGDTLLQISAIGGHKAVAQVLIDAG